MTQIGAPAVGEVLADRYRIEEHVNDDSTGRQVWRGVDVLLQRPVTIVLRTPGGSEADEMLRAAVAASRVVHPNIVGVYDAVDEGARAYVVREWVEGRALRDVILEAPLEPSRCIAVARAVADALSAVHATGVCHGNVHPGTVLLSVDGRVVLGDARINERATPEGDVRAVGAILYAALTGHWPAQLGFNGRTVLPEAPVVEGLLASPRQIRGGISGQLDELVMRLLNPSVPAPVAARLALDLARLSFREPSYHDTGYSDQRYQTAEDLNPLSFVTSPAENGPDDSGSAWRKLAVGMAGLLVIALAGLLVGVGWPNWFAPDTQRSGAEGTAGNTGGGAEETEFIPIKADMVRLVDPPDGDRTEGTNVNLAVDGKDDTGWTTQEYKSAKFGKLKPGMGLLVNLGKAENVSEVHLAFSEPGATVGIKHGDVDPGDTSQGDEKITKSYDDAVEPRQVEATAKLAVDELESQYVLIWITELPRSDDGTYQIEIREIKLVRGAV